MLIKAHLERFFLHRAAKSINQSYIGSICSNHEDGRAEMTSSDRDSVRDPPEGGGGVCYSLRVYYRTRGQVCVCACVVTSLYVRVTWLLPFPERVLFIETSNSCRASNTVIVFALHHLQSGRAPLPPSLHPSPAFS